MSLLLGENGVSVEKQFWGKLCSVKIVYFLGKRFEDVEYSLL
jgi:hypothetical protein